jgi:hypothetical protein
LKECEGRMKRVLDGAADRSEPELGVEQRLRLLAGYRASALAWRRLGVQPTRVAGIGIGAMAAAVEAGVLDLDRVLRELAAGASSLTLAAGARPAVTLVLQGREWKGREPLVISVQEEDGVTFGALHELSPNGIFDIDHACLQLGGERELPQPGDTPAGELLVRVLGALYTRGARLDWAQIMHGRFVRLPTYPWQRELCWLEGGALGDAEQQTAAPEGKVPGDPERLASVHPRPDLYTPYEEPQTPLEKAVAQAWSEVLQISPIGLHDNYLELGGDSLQAMMLLNWAQEALQQTVYTGLLLQSMTVAELAANLRREYPNEVLRVFPDEPGVEEIAEKGPRHPPPGVGQDLAQSPAGRWRRGAPGREPGEPARELAQRPGDQDLPQASERPIEGGGPSPESRRAEELLGRLDDLSDEEVEQLLLQQMVAQETDVEP